MGLLNWSLGGCAVLVACAPARVIERSDKVSPPRPQPSAIVAVKPLRELFASGVAAFNAGQLDQAEASFLGVLAKDPTAVGAQYNLGLIAQQRGNFAEAQKFYEASRKLDPVHLPTLTNLSFVYRMQGQPEKAVALLEEALRSDKADSVAILNQLASAHRLLKDYPKALAAVHRALSYDSKNLAAYKNLVHIYYDQGNYRMAELVIANARKLDEQDASLHNDLGLIYVKGGEPLRAISEFKKAVALDDKFIPGYMNLGSLAFSHRDFAAAERAFAKALQLAPGSLEAVLDHAHSLDAQKGKNPKKGVEAGIAYEQVLKMRPDDKDSLCSAAWAYSADRSGWDRAETLLEKCREVSPPGEQQRILGQIQALQARQKGAVASAGSPEKSGNGAAPSPAPQATTVGDAGTMAGSPGEQSPAADSPKNSVEPVVRPGT